MRVHNPEIAAILNQLADLLEIQGENPFRIRAYRTAARLINDLPQSVADMLDEGEDLTELRNNLFFLSICNDQPDIL